MINLIKNDFIRIRKDKSLFILALIIIGLAVFTSITYLILSFVIKTDPSSKAQLENLGLIVNGKTIILSSFSLTQNGGLLIPIIICLFLYKDFSYGTIRNKIIAGYSRTKIYLSTLITGVTLGIGFILLYFLTNCLFSFILFDYGVDFNIKEFLNLLGLCLCGVLLFFEVSIVSSFFMTITRNIAIGLVCSIAFPLFVSLFAIFSTANNDILNSIISFTSYGHLIDITKGIFSIELLLKTLLSTIVIASVIIIIGNKAFKNADLK